MPKRSFPKNSLRTLSLLACFLALRVALYAEIAAPKTSPAAAKEEMANPPIDLYKTAPKPLTVHADHDVEIGRLVGHLLEEYHYSHIPISPEISQRWLKLYFHELDPNCQFFLQSDIDTFTAKYGDGLGSLLMNNEDEEAAISPAFEIFNRYMMRLQNRIQFVESTVNQPVTFTGTDVFTGQTDKSPWLANLAASDTFWRARVKSDLLSGVLNKKTLAETAKKIAKQYASIYHDATEVEEDQVIGLFLTSLCQAFDPHSEYYDHDDAENFLLSSINPSVTGIGAVLREDDGYATIEEVVTGGPADLDKRLQAGDRIIAVGEGNAEPVDVVNLNLNHVVNLIRGKKGSKVRLVILPAGSTDAALHKDILIRRDLVSIKDSLAKADIIDHITPGGAHEKIGVIELRTFYTKAANDVAKLIVRLKKEEVDGIILDVRNNGGGLLDQAVAVSGLFVKHDQPVVQVSNGRDTPDVLRTEDERPLYTGPLLVMVNQASASATEIVAGALQDYGRALIVGDKSTHGKGTVQQLIPLAQAAPIGFTGGDPGALKITVQKFYRVAGGSTQQRGVIPDIVLPSVLNALQLGETTLPYFLPYDTVAPTDFEYLGETAPYLPDLRARSQARVAESKDFGYVRQDIEFYKKKLATNTLSLNLQTRLAEKASLAAVNAARQKDLLARKSTRDIELELTLDTVDQNGPAVPHIDKKLHTPDANSDDSEANLFSSDNTNFRDDPGLDESVDIMTDYTRLLTQAKSSLVQATVSNR